MAYNVKVEKDQVWHPCRHETAHLVQRDTITHETICKTLQNSLRTSFYSEWFRLPKQRVRESHAKLRNWRSLNYSKCHFFSRHEYSLTASTNVVVNNKDFLYKMPDKGQEMSFSSILVSFWLWFTPIYRTYAWQIFRLEKQNETSTWGLCFLSLHSRIWRKEVRICNKGTAKNNIFVWIWDTVIFKEKLT